MKLRKKTAEIGLEAEYSGQIFIDGPRTDEEDLVPARLRKAPQGFQRDFGSDAGGIAQRNGDQKVLSKPSASKDQWIEI